MVIFAVSYTISIGTFLGRVGLSRQSPMALFILYFGFNGLCTLLFIGLQVGLVLTTLEDRWPLGMLISWTCVWDDQPLPTNSWPRLWVLLLCLGAGHRVRTIGTDLRLGKALCRRTFLWYNLLSPCHHDGVQILGWDYKGGPWVLCWRKAEYMGN